MVIGWALRLIFDVLVSKAGDQLNNTLLNALVEAVEGIKSALKDLGSLEMSKRMQSLPGLPAWCARVVEVRAALAKK